jgi:hypothetical protein
LGKGDKQGWTGLEMLTCVGLLSATLLLGSTALCQAGQSSGEGAPDVRMWQRPAVSGRLVKKFPRVCPSGWPPHPMSSEIVWRGQERGLLLTLCSAAWSTLNTQVLSPPVCHLHTQCVPVLEPGSYPVWVIQF